VAENYGPFDGGAGATLGEDFYFDVMAPQFTYDGVDGDPSSSDLSVYGNSSGMLVLVRVGQAMVRGSGYQLTAEKSVTIAANSSGQTRYDRIVLKHDRTANTLTAIVLAGTPGAGVPPALVQTGTVWELPLAIVTVDTGAVTIASNKVADDRQFLARPTLIVATIAKLPAVARKGQYAYLASTGQTMLYNGTAWTASPADSGFVTVSALSAFTFAGLRFRKLGPVVHIRGYAVRSGAAFGPGMQDAALCTVPTGMLPAANHNYSSWIHNLSASLGAVTLAVDVPTNALRLFSTDQAVPTGAQIYCDTVYTI
jgi:hypothetical protein